MNRLNKIICIVISPIFIGCTENDIVENTSNDVVVTEDNQNAENSIERLKWIEGIWVDSTSFSFRNPPTTYVEEWIYYPDSLSGKGMSVKGNDTIISELLLIREVNGKINYIARPAGQAIIGFPLVSISENEVLFENKAHDFPQKINYINVGKDSLIISISGIIPQGERIVSFKMKDVSF